MFIEVPALSLSCKRYAQVVVAYAGRYIKIKLNK
jgi:hypothetical protein